jgi:hypothetical protein
VTRDGYARHEFSAFRNEFATAADYGIRPREIRRVIDAGDLEAEISRFLDSKEQILAVIGHHLIGEPKLAIHVRLIKLLDAGPKRGI